MAQALGDIVGGQVEVLCEATTVLLPLIEAGHVVPLLVMNPTRLPELPDVPTAAEAGLPDLLVSVWAGLLAPAGTPAAIVDRLNTALVEALRSPEMRESLVKLGATPNSGSPREFATFLESEVSRWGGVVRAMELKAE
jgi:tripartite-type tricarboxylate transporter receptor subunit TctC